MTDAFQSLAVPDDPAGAFCRQNHVALKGAESGPLAGYSFGVKDIFDIEGTCTGFGNPTWLATHPAAQATASAVRKMLNAGADMTGRTLTDEMAYSLTGENVHYGTPINPKDPARIPGGSSNGSASAVANGLVDFALGTDCGGSVRLPASYCGILGIRPTLGRIAVDGIVPFAASFDVVGWFAQSADLMSRVAAQLFDEPRQAGSLRRILVAEDAFDFVSDEISDALQPALNNVRGHASASGTVRVSEESLEDWFNVFRVIQASEIWANHGAWINANNPALGPGVRERMEWASNVSAGDVVAMRRRHTEIRQKLDGLLGEGDVLCIPSSPRIAPLRDAPVDDIEVRFRHQAMCLLCISGLGGLPQISLPLAELDGMPLGLSLIARRGNDEMLLELARALIV